MRLILPLLLFASLTTQTALARFEAHEWGTFTSLVGSNGVPQDGMYHEDERLPAFVHGFGVTQADLRKPPPSEPVPPRRPCRGKGCFDDFFFDQNVITQKMETPVIYFYSDAQRSVDVNVRFPEGIVTETFPAPIATSPTRGDIRTARNGNTTFRVDVLPTTTGTLPAVESGNIYGHARNVNANLVRTFDEQEKFIFYRGIGRFFPRISIRSEGSALSLGVANPRDLPQSAFLVHVDEHGQGQYIELSLRTGRPLEVPRQQIELLKQHSPFPPHHTIKRGTRGLVDALVRAGLYTDEAEAMIKTWEHGYLKVPGLRLLYVLPRAEADEILPLTLTPAPEKLERAFVGRIEILLDSEEREIVGKLLRERESFQVKSLGRFAHAMLLRAKEVMIASGQNSAANLQLVDRFITEAAKGE